MDVCCLLFSKLPVQCYAAGMVNTVKVAACVTAAGKAPSATFPPTSASTSHAAATGPASWEPASATQATKGKTVKKVIVLISHGNVSLMYKVRHEMAVVTILTMFNTLWEC